MEPLSVIYLNSITGLCSLQSKQREIYRGQSCCIVIHLALVLSALVTTAFSFDIMHSIIGAQCILHFLPLALKA